MMTSNNFRNVLDLPCVVVEDPPLIFFRVPKVASTSIHRGYFRQHYSTLNMKTSRKSFIEFRDQVSYAQFMDMFKFTFVRNPWDRMLSLYMYFTTFVPKSKGSPLSERWVGRIPSFQEFVMEFESICKVREDIKNHAIPQTQFAFYKNYRYVNFIGKFESLKKDFKFVQDTLNLVKDELLRKMSTEHGHYSMYYDRETKEKVAELYKEDIETFGYKYYKSKLLGRTSPEPL